MERYFFLMSVFFLGYWMAINRAAFERLTSARVLLIAGPLALALAIFAVRSGDIRYEVEYYPAVFAAILVVIGGARQLDRSRLANMLIFVGRNSVVFFVVHYPLIYVWRSEEHTSELQSLMRISYAVFCFKKKKQKRHLNSNHTPKKHLITREI